MIVQLVPGPRWSPELCEEGPCVCVDGQPHVWTKRALYWRQPSFRAAVDQSAVFWHFLRNASSAESFKGFTVPARTLLKFDAPTPKSSCWAVDRGLNSQTKALTSPLTLRSHYNGTRVSGLGEILQKTQGELKIGLKRCHLGGTWSANYVITYFASMWAILVLEFGTSEADIFTTASHGHECTIL